MAKDVIYIDIEDEITGVIDKVLSSKNKVVALVLPKRTTLFQSAVNMKLLKKSAAEQKKGIVLVTSEESVMNLAGSSAIHVAKTLNSKPYVPKASSPVESETVISDSEYTTEDGALKQADSEPEEEPEQKSNDNDETIEIDNSDGDAVVVDKASKVKAKLKKGMKIPDFSSFRLRFFLAIFLVVVLIVGGVFAFVVAPKASVTIATDSSSFEAVVSFRAKTDQKDLDETEKLVPAVKVSIKKTDVDKSAVTGKKDIGEKAVGQMTLTNCIKDNNSHTVPAGTGFTTGSYTFVINEAVELNPSVFAGSNCLSDDLPSFGAQKTVAVTAGASGQAYNLTARSYSSPISGISAYGSDMAGGTTNEVKAVTQPDIDAAKQRLGGKSKTIALEELSKQLTDQGKKPLPETLSESAPVYKVTPALDAQAEEVTVTADVTYELLGVDESHLKTLLTNVINQKAEELSQKGIQSDGYDTAQYRLADKKSNDDVALSLVTVSIIGPKIDTESLKTQIAGKKRGDIETLVEAIPGVKNVRVEYEPFWVFQTPKNVNKITVTINQAQ